MHRLPTVLLHHVTGQGSHYDWLLGDPTNIGGRLWAARIGFSSRHWPARRSWLVEEIVPHRRAYLTYQGPVSGGRGSVRRVDQGYFTARLWAVDRRVVDVRMACAVGTVTLTRLAERRWQAAWVRG